MHGPMNVKSMKLYCIASITGNSSN